MDEVRVGVIGGSGLYAMPDLHDAEQVTLTTPFGDPSDEITVGTLAGVRVAFIPRHGRSHRIMPSDVPARANFWALKRLGARSVLSVSAVGSMREHIRPLDLVVPDQVLDHTTMLRPRTFFDDGLVAHVGLAEPFCPDTRRALVDAARRAAPVVHDQGTYICIEGPQFSTMAESRVYRSWGVDVIGMTAMPEARLAREAELCFGVLALVTDYDVWHESEAPVSVDTVVGNLHRNVEIAQQVIRSVVPALAERVDCSCRHALDHAIVTSQANLSAHQRERLAFFLGDRLD